VQTIQHIYVRFNNDSGAKYKYFYISAGASATSNSTGTPGFGEYYYSPLTAIDVEESRRYRTKGMLWIEAYCSFPNSGRFPTFRIIFTGHSNTGAYSTDRVYKTIDGEFADSVNPISSIQIYSGTNIFQAGDFIDVLCFIW
jgi:hypothetical protein